METGSIHLVNRNRNRNLNPIYKGKNPNNVINNFSSGTDLFIFTSTAQDLFE